MKPTVPVYFEKDIIPSLIEYVTDQKMREFTLITDEIEYRILGKRVVEALKKEGFRVGLVLLTGEHVSADAAYIFKVLLDEPGVDTTYIAVGSGTVTDITRFVAAVTRMRYLSLPTATSVDAYASGGSALTVEGFKKHAESGRLPDAIFADLKTLGEAPRKMIASGIGDTIAKFNAVADWKLAHLVTDEGYNEEIAQRSLRAAKECARIALDLEKNYEENIRQMLEALVESGLCMVEMGNSFPASGTEHHFSHFWEMRMLIENRPPALHGAKVGIGTIYAARYWERVRQISAAQARELASKAPLPTRAEMEEEIRRIYGPATNQVMSNYAYWLELDAAGYTATKKRIVDNWAKILEIAATVPSPQEVTGWLEKVGGPTQPAQLEIGERNVQDAVNHSHYIRRAFSVHKLCRLLGVKLD